MKQFFTIILACAISPICFSQFSQIGQDINGVTNDQSGYSLSLNSSGGRIVIGGFANSSVANNNGVARMYEYDGSVWVQMGQDIYGAANDVLGNSVAIDDSGDRVVIAKVGNNSQSGAVEVYEYNGNSWDLLGQTILAEEWGELFGYSVAISSNGNRIVVGAAGTDAGAPNGGSARVYEFNGASWVQIGQDVYGLFNEMFGSAVSIDPTGGVIAVGGPNEGAGVVRVYGFNGVSWVQMGSNLLGASTGNEYGTSVSLGSDGNFVAVGAPFGGGQSRGTVQVYQLNGSNWVQTAQTIIGDIGDRIGGFEGVSIEPIGERLVVGSTMNNAVGSYSGQARVYFFDGSSWVLGGVIDGESSGDKMGQVSISDDGQKVACGARYNTGGGQGAGQARVFELKSVGIDNNELASVSVYPNPSRGIINIKSDAVITSVEVYDLQGRKLDTYEYNSQLQLRQTKGVYLLRIVQDNTVLGLIRIELL